MIKLDILAFGAHPDDVELAASGTLLKHKSLGLKVGIVDLTRGEMGTRGTASDRDIEAQDSAKILGLDARENLGLEDAFFEVNKENKIRVASAIRTYQPDIILAPAIKDRHPDHTNAGQLVAEAAFIAGLRKLETVKDGTSQDPWRPKRVFHYIQYNYRTPDFVIDISDHFDQKMDAIRAFKSQFYDPNSKEPETLISAKGFFDYVKARAVEMGSINGVKYGEGFESGTALQISNLKDLL